MATGITEPQNSAKMPTLNLIKHAPEEFNTVTLAGKHSPQRHKYTSP
jgi:hypothetical protein